jgi:hypothetical protein
MKLSLQQLSRYLMLALLALPSAFAAAKDAKPSCRPVGGSLMTNFGAVDQNTTLGTATGDLKGAVAATVLSVVAGANGTVVFTVQHHWVTEAGDSIAADQAQATTLPLSQTLFAVITYSLHITGGTGRFAGATGDLHFIGEADLVEGTVFRYTGKVCFSE